MPSTDVTTRIASPLAGSPVRGPSPAIARPPEAQRENTPPKAPAPAATPELPQVVQELNTLVQNLRRELHFSIDEHSGLTVITVVDAATDQVLRRIPPEQVLNLVEKFQRTGTTGMLDVTA